MRRKIFSYILTIAMSASVIGGAFAATARNSVKGYLAIIIDDFGYDGEATEAMLEMDIPLTAAVMPFSECTEKNCKQLCEAGKEIIVHMPMEAKTGQKSWVGKKGIFMDMSKEEIKNVAGEAFDIIDSAVGFNNHMGSAIMESEQQLNAVMEVAADRNKIFVDSLTTANSVGKKVAEENDVSYLERSVFIDCPGNAEAVSAGLKKAAQIAKEKGYAIAIGHVGPAGGKTTAEGIKQAKEAIEAMGVEFVTISKLNEIANCVDTAKQ
ncbi:putative protein [Clostridiales bacterium]|nr:putative protein [Clostridiales bacterium]